MTHGASPRPGFGVLDKIRRVASEHPVLPETPDGDADYQKNCSRVSKMFGSSLRSAASAELYFELFTAT